MNINEKLNKLENILKDFKSVVVAYSGGVDSTFLLFIAYRVLKNNCIAYTARSASISKQELLDAVRFANKIGVEHVIEDYEETVESADYTRNPENRCYYCKKILFGKIKTYTQKRGINYILEGSNMDDLQEHRPGMKAVLEYGVKSPLKEAGLTKADIRILSKKFNLPTWNKPEMACLASRIPYGEEITIEKLKMVEEAEAFIKSFGVYQLRVRNISNCAKIEVNVSDIPIIKQHFTFIEKKLKSIGFTRVLIDEKGYRRGALNEGLNL